MEKRIMAIRRYLIQESILILLLSYIIMFASTHNGLVDQNVKIVTAVILTILAAFWIWLRPNTPGRLEGPVFIFLVALVASSAMSIDPRRSFSEAWLISVEIFLFLFVISLVKHGWPAELFIKVLLIVGAIVLALAWLGVYFWYSAWLATSPGKWLPDIVYRPPAPNFLAVFFNVLLMCALARLFYARDWIARIFLGLWSALAIGMIILTSSRGGWIGTAAGLGVLVLTSYLLAREKWVSVWKWFWSDRLRMLLIGSVALIMVGALGYFLFRLTMHPTHGALLDSRTEYWGPAMMAFRSSRLLGVGPFTFISFFLQLNSVPPKELYVYAHSIYLDALSSGGLFGLFAMLYLFFMVAVTLVSQIRQRQGLNRSVAIGALAAFAAFTVHGFFDSVHHTIPTSAWIFAIIMGAGVAGEGPGLQRFFRTPVLLGVAVAVIAWFFVWLAAPLNDAVQLANSGDWKNAVVLMEVARQRDSNQAIAHQQTGLAQSILAGRGEPGALEKAVSAFERTVEIDPYWALNRANLGVLYREKGDLNKAHEQLQEAVKLAPDSPIYYLNLGQVEEARSNKTGAHEAYFKALEFQPDWAEANFWHQTPFRFETLSDWQKTSRKSEKMSISQLENARLKYPDDAVMAMSLAEAYLEQNQLQKAEELINKAGLMYLPTADATQNLIWMQAALQAAKGDLPGAISKGQGALDSFKWQGIHGPGTMGSLMYAPTMFRSPATPVEFVPQTTLILLPGPWANRMLMLGDWYAKTGNLEKAKNVYQELLELKPDMIEAKQRLAK
jgi:tetratricopeptide (TPR) repeat protein/O-antigen ligase